MTVVAFPSLFIILDEPAQRLPLRTFDGHSA